MDYDIISHTQLTHVAVIESLAQSVVYLLTGLTFCLIPSITDVGKKKKII